MNTVIEIEVTEGKEGKGGKNVHRKETLYKNQSAGN